jgi:putative endonuclease
MKKRTLGNSGEDSAAHYIESLGWRIIDRNAHFRLGEIDILADTGKEMAIIEVKAKTSYSHGAAVEMITKSKQRVLKVLAKIIEQEYNKPVRIDVIAIDEFNTSNQILTHYPFAISE